MESMSTSLSNLTDETENNSLSTEMNLMTSNITSTELDTDTTNKLRGDAIGDTMYSEVFVLKTLMKLENFDWTTEFEDDLCFLWDMTQEKVVCDYLLEMLYPALACNALAKNKQNNRFVEIIVGIYANILCNNQKISLENEEIEFILSILESDDPLVLIQVMRFIHAISFKFNQLGFINQQIYDQFDFILNNSMNCDLLLHTLKTLATITDYKKLNENILNGDILKSIVIAYQTITGDNNQPNSLAMKYLIQIVSSICVYIDDLNVNRLIDETKPHLDLFMYEISKLFHFYTDEENLIPVSDELEFYIESFLFIFVILPISYSTEIMISLCKILLILIDNESDTIHNFAQLISRFLILSQPDKVQTDLNSQFNENTIKIIMKIVKKYAVNCNFNYLSQLEVV